MHEQLDSTRHGERRWLAAAAGLLALAVLGLAGCSGGADTVGAKTPAGASKATVHVASVNGFGNVLVDSRGAALYSPLQERNGTIRCTGACTSIWTPLTLSASAERPTAAGGLGGQLGTITRSGGVRQVTFGGRPLYEFVEDRPGSVTGNGFRDEFGGVKFTWRAVTPTGAAAGGSTTTSRTYGY